jgi:ABC-2 type transport system permease protein
LCYFWFVRNKEFLFNLSFVNVLFFIISCSLSFCIYFLLKFIIGVASFWFTEIDWLSGLEELTFWFFGGLLMPLDLLPSFMQKIANFLPFKYLIYLPAQGLLNKLTSIELITALSVQAFWIIGLIYLSKKIYQNGLKAYSTFGG